MVRSFSTGIEVPTAGDRHPSEAWWSRVGATTNAAILNETGKVQASSTAAVDALRKTVTQDYVDRATAAQYGIPGPSASLRIGTVSVGSVASASITGTSPNQVLNLTYSPGPRGPEGPGGAFQMKETADPGLFEVSDVPSTAIQAAAQPLIDAAKWDRGVLPDGTDFNTVRRQGVYTVASVASAATMINSPSPRAGILRVESNDSYQLTIQSYETYVSSATDPERQIRATVSSAINLWSPWTSKKWVNGLLPEGTNLQTFRQAGVWMVGSTTAAATMTDLPVNSPGVLEVLSSRETGRSMQRFTSDTSGKLEVYARTSGTLSTMPAWTLVSGGGQSTTITSDSAFVGANGRLYVVVAGVMRNPGTGWAALDDTIHRHANVESVNTGADSITVNFPSVGAKKVVSFVCTPDETLTKAGYACAASVSLTTAEITLARYTPMSDYVQYNATNGWTSLNGVFRNFSFSNGTLSMEHDPIGGSNFMDFQVTGRGDVLVSGSAQAGGSTQTLTKIDFRDYAGALVTTASPSLRAYVSRGSSGPVDPTTLTTTRFPASNIWFQGIFEL